MKKEKSKLIKPCQLWILYPVKYLKNEDKILKFSDKNWQFTSNKPTL